VEKKMKYNITLLDSETSIRNSILQALQSVLSKAIGVAIPKIEKDIKNAVAEALRQEPEYSSLLGGTLLAEFGLHDSSSVEKVVQALVQTLKVKTEPVSLGRYGLKGGFSLTMMKSDDMDGVIFLDSASVMDNERGYILPWLDWLLYRNNEPIVKNYSVSYVNSPYSRSGLAIMIPDDTNWRVPPEFAGSIKNNWTTRAISRLDPLIYKIIQSNIEAAL
jgi:hypothetical protein